MPILKREDYKNQEQYNNAVYTAVLLAETYNLKGLNELLAKDTKNVIYKHAIYLKTKVNKWYEDKDNFPCMLIANLDGGDALVWVHYCIDGFAYDLRDNRHTLIGHTNWRRATKQEILDNVKGL
jgi:hypothetical protein